MLVNNHMPKNFFDPYSLLGQQGTSFAEIQHKILVPFVQQLLKDYMLFRTDYYQSLAELQC